MKSSHDRPDPKKGTEAAKSPRLAEVLQVVEEYANDLEEIIKTLRDRLH